MRIIFYTLFLLFLFSNQTWSQNDRLYSMFVFNKLQYNPAYAGSADALNIGAHYRHQWQGLEGAPKTITAFAHMPILSGRSGVGLSIVADEIGIFNTTYTKIDYAYRIGFKNDTKLSFGINAQFDFTRFDWTKAELIDNIDTAIPFGEPSGNALNFGGGIYYSGKNFFIGASVPNLMRNAITSSAYASFGQLRDLRAHYLMGGLVFKINPKIHIKPSLLISYIENAPNEIDFNLSLLFLESFWIGGSYRLDESADAFVQFPLTQQLKVAIGVDYALTELNSFTKGSFEVMVEYLFKYDNAKVNNIRFF